MFGDYIAFFTLPYFMLVLTGEALALGLTAFAETLPMLLFGLAAGVFLDRRKKLGRTLISADLVRSGAFLFLAYAVGTEWMSSGIILVTAFLVGSMAVLFDSGFQSYMTQSLASNDLIKANSRLALARTLTLSVGPLVGGVIVSVGGGFTAAFILNAATFAVSAVFLAFVRPVKAVVPRSHEPFGQAIMSGLRVLFADERLKWGTIGGTLTNFVFQPLEALLVLFVAQEILHVETVGDVLTQEGASVGIFIAAQAAIGSIGVAFASKVSTRLSLGAMYIVGLSMLGGGFLLVVLTGSWIAVIPAGIAVTGVTWVNVALVTLRQRLAPQDQMGRVIAASRTLAWAGLPLGAALGGLLASAFGIVPVYLAGSIGVLVVTVLLSRTALLQNRVMATGDHVRPQAD